MLTLRTVFNPYTTKSLSVPFRFLLENYYYPATDPIQPGSTLDQRITALGSVAVRHIVFLANVYSLCVYLAYACASVFSNRTFGKIPASCLFSILRKDNRFREVEAWGGWWERTRKPDSNALNNGRVQFFSTSQTFQSFYLSY